MKVKIGFFSVMLFLSLLLSHSFFALAAFLSVLIHELAHIAAAKLLKIRLTECKIGIYGAGLSPDSKQFSYKDEIFLCFAGPVSNYISILLLLPLYLYLKNDFLLYFLLSSLILGTLNILPIKSFDGGRILYSILCIFKDPFLAETTLSVISFLLIFIIWCFSVYLLLVAGAGLSLFIFSLSLFSRFFVKEN